MNTDNLNETEQAIERYAVDKACEDGLTPVDVIEILQRIAAKIQRETKAT